MRVFAGVEEFAAAQGEDLGATEWLVVDQERITSFADATGDQQWIHVDPERAAEGPFGATIAHGLLTLSLLPVLLQQLYRVDGISMAINYGFDKVRFINPVPVGSTLRARSTIVEVTPLGGAVQGTLATTIEIQGQDRPAAVVESIVRYVA